MDDEDTLPLDERRTVKLVSELIRDGRTAPLIAVLRGEDGGLERARDALVLLGELDHTLLVQVALDALIDAHVDDPARAEQTRRVVRGTVR